MTVRLRPLIREGASVRIFTNTEFVFDAAVEFDDASF
jgi:hypothetical protein